MTLHFNANDYADENDNSDDGVDILTEDVECDVLEDRQPDTIARLAPVHTRLVPGGMVCEG